MCGNTFEKELSGKVYRVTEIEKLAFNERKNIVSVKIPNSLTLIDEVAFFVQACLSGGHQHRTT
ncbi:MAG: leucine-rich repeat domain-containing protein [Paludibacteraceae bacterium]|nr:leucine-rich repeat domain-containing protein [Paludibacteraceae bacterium]